MVKAALFATSVTFWEMREVSGDGVLAECYGRSEVFMTAGTLVDHGHHSIEAYGERAVVKGCVTRRITLADGARMLREITNKE